MCHRTRGVWIITISICRLTTNVAYTDVVMSNPPQNAKVFEPVECSMTKMDLMISFPDEKTHRKCNQYLRQFIGKKAFSHAVKYERVYTTSQRSRFNHAIPG